MYDSRRMVERNKMDSRDEAGWAREMLEVSIVEP